MAGPQRHVKDNYSQAVKGMKWEVSSVVNSKLKTITPRLAHLEKARAALAIKVNKVQEDVTENSAEILEIRKALDDDNENKTLGLITEVDNLQKANKNVVDHVNQLEKNRPRVILPDKVETYSKQEIDDTIAKV